MLDPDPDSMNPDLKHWNMILYLHFVRFLLTIKINSRGSDGFSNGRHIWQVGTGTVSFPLLLVGFLSVN
jgi:hypothetical protein